MNPAYDHSSEKPQLRKPKRQTKKSTTPDPITRVKKMTKRTKMSIPEHIRPRQGVRIKLPVPGMRIWHSFWPTDKLDHLWAYHKFCGAEEYEVIATLDEENAFSIKFPRTGHIFETRLSEKFRLKLES